MVEFILENPIGVAIVGVGLALLAFITWVQTGEAKILYLFLATLLVTIALVAVSWRVVTEREELTAMIDQTAKNLENNQFPAVIDVIYERPSEAVLNAKSLLKTEKYIFTAARVKKIHKMNFSGPADRRQGFVTMNVFVEGRLGGFHGGTPRYVELTLVRVNGEWKVTDFSHADAFEGFKGRAALSSELP
jgi:hypothetical protein